MNQHRAGEDRDVAGHATNRSPVPDVRPGRPAPRARVEHRCASPRASPRPRPHAPRRSSGGPRRRPPAARMARARSTAFSALGDPSAPHRRPHPPAPGLPASRSSTHSGAAPSPSRRHRSRSRRTMRERAAWGRGGERRRKRWRRTWSRLSRGNEIPIPRVVQELVVEALRHDPSGIDDHDSVAPRERGCADREEQRGAPGACVAQPRQEPPLGDDVERPRGLSSTSTGGLAAYDRATVSRWRWPPDSERPRSPIGWSMPLRRVSKSSPAASRSARSNVEGSASGAPSARFSLSVPSTSHGWWPSTVTTCERNASNDSSRASTPPTNTRPCSGSTRRTRRSEIAAATSGSSATTPRSSPSATSSPKPDNGP